MNCTWQQTSAERIEIRAGRKPLLLLFGLPFLAIGIWMYWNFFGALMDVVRGRVGLLDNVFGLVLLPVFGALFAFPGVVVLMSKTWVADGAERRLKAVTSLGFKSWAKVYPLDDFTAVRTYRGKASARGFDDTVEDQVEKEISQPYCVELTPSSQGKAAQVVGAFDQAPAARGLGSALAAALRLPHTDDTSESAFA